MLGHRHGPRRRLPVTAYLVAAFGTCSLFLTLVVVEGSRTTFDRERQHAEHDLRAITREQQNLNGDLLGEIEGLRDGIGMDPRIQSLIPSQCQEVFAGFEGVLQEQHLHVFAADGTEVCAVYPRSSGPVHLDVAGWLPQLVEEDRAVALDPEIDELTGKPSVVLAAPLWNAEGAVIGAVVGVTGTASWEAAVPEDAPEGAVILVLDRARDLVLSTSANAPVAPGDRVDGTVLAHPMRSGAAITDVDGVRACTKRSPLPRTAGTSWPA